VLLDRQAPEPVREAVKSSIEAHDDNRVADLHVWSVGPDICAAIVAVVTHDPKSPDHYKKLIPRGLDVVHLTVEVHRCLAEGHPEEGNALAVTDEAVRAAD
jgi:Co/Zn/Cd efflux system component